MNLFVNSAWTAEGKVPKKTPFGEELVYGTNAFESLSNAKIYAYEHPSYAPFYYHDFDKEITFYNGLGLTQLRSQEIKPTFKEDAAKHSYAAYSKIAPTGTITVIFSPVDLELSGYKSVTINPTTNYVYTVLGGNNQIAHTFNETYGKTNVQKESATVAGKADGTLILNGVAQVEAGGVYASAYGMANDDILPTVAAFKPAEPGNPWTEAWGTSKTTVLSALPGYANVTIEGGGSALNLAGGTLNYSRIAEATYTSDYLTLIALNKSCSSGTAATGVLTIDGGNVQLATKYATVKVYNGSEFDNLIGGAESDSAKTTYTYTPGTLTKKATIESAYSISATGSIDIAFIGPKSGDRNVSGYAKVTVGDAELGDLYAATYKENRKETTEIVSSGTAKEKITSTYSSSCQNTGGGTLTASKGAFWARMDSAVGFTNVNLVGATVSGRFSLCEYGIPYSCGETSSSTESGYFLQTKYTSKFNAAVTGAATLKDSLVSHGITGYQTLKLTDTVVSSGIAGGKATSDVTTTENRSEKNGVITSTHTSQEKWNDGTVGTLTMAGGGLKTAKISNYATVTLDGVTGNVSYASGGNSASENKLTLTMVGGVETLCDSNYLYTGGAAGTLTVNNGYGLTLSGVSCYAKVTMDGGKLKGDVVDGWAKKSTDAEKRTSDTKKDIRNLSSSSYSSQGATGSVALTDVDGDAANIYDYRTIMLDGTTVRGVYTSVYVGSDASSKELTDGGGTTLKSAWVISTSYAPNAELTLKNGASVTSDAFGIKTLSLDSGTFVGSTVEMVGSRYYNSASYNSNGGKFTSTCVFQDTSSACGTVTAGVYAYTGNISGAAKVTGTSAVFGDLTGDTLTSESKETTTNVSSSYSETMTSSAAATATLTDGGAGTLVGYGNVKLNSAAYIDSAFAGNSKWTYSETSATALYSRSHLSEYNVAGALTMAPDTAVNYNVWGYATVALDSAAIGGAVGGAREKMSEDLKKTFTSDGSVLTNQTYTSESVSAPGVTLTIKNAGAYVGGNVSGIKTLTLGVGNVGVYGNVDMTSFNSKITDKITYNQKTGVYEEKREEFRKESAGGTITAVDDAIIDGDVTGAAKVTLTDAWLSSDTIATNVTESRTLIVKGPVVSGNFDSSAWVGLDHATEVTSQYISSGAAAGNFTLTRGQAAGIEGYAAVKLTSATVGYAFAGTHKDTETNVYKNGIDTLTSVYSSGGAGTLTATSVSFIDTTLAVGGFATVTLTDCTGAGGKFYGGSYEETRSGVGNGVTYDVASNNASNNAAADYVDKAAGTFTALRTNLGGNVYDYATVNLTDCTGDGVSATYNSSVKTTVTLGGSNTFTNAVYGFNTVTVKNGETAADGFGGTDGNDTFTVNAGAAVQTGYWYSTGGEDKAVINGTLRLLGTTFENVGGTLSVSGSGIIAVKDSDFAAVLAKLNAPGVTVKGVELVAAGASESTVVAIRTKKEELADDTAKGARKFEGVEMNGWLSSEVNVLTGKFADTVDWIKFKYEEFCDYSVKLDDSIRHNDVTVELYKGGTKIQDVAWTGGKFDIDEVGLAAGTEYQLKLSIAPDNKEALAYNVTKS